MKVFTTARVENGTILLWEQHLKRLYLHAARLGICVPEISHSTLIKQIPSSGIHRLRIDLFENGHYTLDVRPYIPISHTQSIRLKTVETPTTGTLAQVKSVCRAALREKAQAAGYDDALTVDRQGFLLEGTYANLYWIDQGVLYTPSPELDLMWGLTISQLAAEAPKLQVGRYHLEEISPEADVRLCNCLVEIPVASIDAGHVSWKRKG